MLYRRRRGCFKRDERELFRHRRPENLSAHQRNPDGGTGATLGLYNGTAKTRTVRNVGKQERNRKGNHRFGFKIQFCDASDFNGCC